MKSNNILIQDYKDFDYGFLTTCLAVAETYGNGGRLAMLDNGENLPLTTKDGANVSRSIRFSNKTANFGAIAAITGAATTLSLVADSTTLTNILMHSYVSKIDRKKFNKKVEAGVEIAVNEVYEHLENLTRKANKEDLKQIAKVAANGSEEVAKIITDAYNYAGQNGLVEVVFRKDKGFTEFVKQDGMMIPNGFASPYFVNKEEKKLAFEAENVSVLLSATWEYSQHIISQIQEFYRDRPRSDALAIFIERSNSDMTEKLVGIKNVGYNILLVPCGSYDEYTAETMLNDIALFTSASVYNPRNPDSKIIFGLADKIVSTVDGTSIIVEKVPKEFKELLKKLESVEQRDEARIKRLTTKAAVIEVSALTESSGKELLDRIDDAVASVKTTSQEGYVSGGGSTLAYISGLMKQKLHHKEKQLGYDTVIKVLQSPILRLLKNSNRYNPKWYEFWKINYLEEAMKTYGRGYNCDKDEVSDLITDGILDSKKAIRVALQSATERSMQVLNLGLIVHYPEKLTLD